MDASSSSSATGTPPAAAASEALTAVLVAAMASGCDATNKHFAWRARLAKEVGVSDAQRIKVWFLNHRRKRETLRKNDNESLLPNEDTESRDPALRSRKKQTIERRQETFREKPTGVMQTRIDRATQTTMRLLSTLKVSKVHVVYRVISSTNGTSYTCSIKQRPECECIDFEMGKNCKHILFVFLKVLKLDPTNPLVFQKALLSTELETMFEDAKKHDPVYVVQPDNLSDAVWCEYSCGGNVHANCYALWKKATGKCNLLVHTTPSHFALFF
ncbi:hypothetical protein HDU98_005497 [Podochytrium sp. JEL0797]|nr:hypothetical protein HDU98_005497 [Podochytrium sp. JEL0797]